MFSTVLRFQHRTFNSAEEEGLILGRERTQGGISKVTYLATYGENWPEQAVE